MEKIEIGIITKPQGLKGDFRLKHNQNAFSIIKALEKIDIADNTYTVTAITDRGGFFVIKTKELTDINQVETLRGNSVYTFVDVEVANKVNNNLGYSIFDGKGIVGVVTQVDNYGSTDIYTLDNGSTFAVAPNLIVIVDDDKKIVTVNKDVLGEVMI